ncbi:unnamed protein product [Bursaphelenchus okinawaensis]|uniref:Uncharacterized protein n=1 Tax=Bursaphelenchus okinawaensis TaxID=465554 RepID=A0A811L5G4_9BILA|nr:unnamed protein product [Bursaphelenchus okinawaensis]CAG9118054.1 unnamed protein product [Bursaphelenchus okinawaensis]
MVKLFLISLILTSITLNCFGVCQYEEQDMKCAGWWENNAIFELKSQICLMCHQLRGHGGPNFRARCAHNCFHNRDFPTCMNDAKSMIIQHCDHATDKDGCLQRMKQLQPYERT